MGLFALLLRYLLMLLTPGPQGQRANKLYKPPSGGREMRALGRDPTQIFYQMVLT